MSTAIGGELHQFLNCLWYGVVLFGVYDGLRIWRVLLQHAVWVIGLEDVFFWVWAAFYLFSHFFVDTYGAVRLYQLLGVGFGGIIWEYGCGRFLIKKVIFCIRWLKFRVRRCKLFIGMRSLMLQKKNEKRIKKMQQKKDATEKSVKKYGRKKI